MKVLFVLALLAGLYLWKYQPTLWKRVVARFVAFVEGEPPLLFDGIKVFPTKDDKTYFVEYDGFRSMWIQEVDIDGWVDHHWRRDTFWVNADQESLELTGPEIRQLDKQAHLKLQQRHKKDCLERESYLLWDAQDGD